MKKHVFAGLLVSLAALGACGKAADPTATASTDPVAGAASGPAADPDADPSLSTAPRPASLPARFDCVREAGSALVVAHRGGPTRDYPENALETLKRTLEAGSTVMEVDIAQTRDGVLFLMHDDDLDRTSTGEGPVGDRTWAEIQPLTLETYQTGTAFHPPTLDDVLDWAVASNVLLELDRKRATSVDKVLDAIKARNAAGNVIVITYTDDQAVEVHAAAPELMITATVRSLDQLDELIARGVKADRLIAWTGIEAPDPALWKALAGRGVESAFGTQNARDTKRDSEFWEDGDGSEYNDLVADGLTLLITGYSDKVSRQLSGDQAARAACGF